MKIEAVVAFRKNYRAPLGFPLTVFDVTVASLPDEAGETCSDPKVEWMEGGPIVCHSARTGTSYPVIPLGSVAHITGGRVSNKRPEPSTPRGVDLVLWRVLEK